MEFLAHRDGDGVVREAVDQEIGFVELGHRSEIVVAIGDEAARDLGRHRAQAGEGADRHQRIELLPHRQAERDTAAEAVADDDYSVAAGKALGLGVERVGIAREAGFVGSAGIARIAAIFGGDHAIARGDERCEPVERAHRARRVAVENEQRRLARPRCDFGAGDGEAVARRQRYPLRARWERRGGDRGGRRGVDPVMDQLARHGACRRDEERGAERDQTDTSLLHRIPSQRCLPSESGIV